MLSINGESIHRCVRFIGVPRYSVAQSSHTFPLELSYLLHPRPLPPESGIELLGGLIWGRVDWMLAWHAVLALFSTFHSPWIRACGPIRAEIGL